MDVLIVQAVADRRGIDPIDLPPLYEWVDPDAIERVFDPPTHHSAGERRFVFTYAGYTVTVERDDDLSITVDDRPDKSRSDR